MKKRFSGIVCAATLILMLTALAISMVSQGRLFRPRENVPPLSLPPGDLVVIDGDRALININTADEAALMQISGIGEALSSLIVAARSENGPFSRVEDLLNLSGIGEAKLEAIRPYIYCQQEDG